MRELPTGTVTLLFTDIEGSTKLLHELAFLLALIAACAAERELAGRLWGAVEALHRQRPMETWDALRSHYRSGRPRGSVPNRL